MKFFVLDANVLIAFLDKTDSCHKTANNVLSELLTSSEPLKIIVPRITIPEIAVTLKTKGLSGTAVEEALNGFLGLPYVVVLDISEMQIHKFVIPLPKRQEGTLVRTTDYLVGVLARVLDGIVLTFDKKLPNMCSFAKCMTIDDTTDVIKILKEES